MATATQERSETQQVLALLQSHRREVALYQMRIERLEAALREHGIPLPPEDRKLGASSADHLAACKAVVTAAYELLPHLELLREMVGSGMELLEDDWALRS